MRKMEQGRLQGLGITERIALTKMRKPERDRGSGLWTKSRSSILDNLSLSCLLGSNWRCLISHWKGDSGSEREIWAGNKNLRIIII